LQLKEDHRLKKLAKVKTSSAKNLKNKRKYEKLKEDTRIAKKEWHKREGTYRRGMNLDLPMALAVPVPKKQGKGHCEYCGLKGHSTARSRKCKAKPGDPKQFRVDGTLLCDDQKETDDDIEDCNNFDAMPLEALPQEAEMFGGPIEYCSATTARLDDAWNLPDSSNDDNSVQPTSGNI
jgi:hypothetical protein